MADPYFITTLPFNASVDIGPTPPSQLSALISSSPNLKIYTRASPSFAALKHIWNITYQAHSPLAIIRATTSADVSAVIKHCASNHLPVTVRNGGHDLWGRSLIHDAVVLDIRELTLITLAEDRKSVTVGGGVQTGPLIDFLDGYGLVTPSTLAGMVGHVGWSFMGGFGPLVNSFGLGVDQILGAKIVTADGVEQEADAELLWGIKGAGGAFGVLTEVKFKVYELPKLLGGMLVFKFDEAAKIYGGLQTLVEGGIGPLTIGVHFAKHGQAVFTMAFSWASSDFEEGRKWLDKIKSLGIVLMDTVAEISMKQWCDSIATMLPPPSYNSSRSVFTQTLTPAAVQALLSAAENIPDGVTWAITAFFVSGPTVKARSDSCFKVREPFVFLHALAPTADQDRVGESQKWTSGIYDELKKLGLVKNNYLAIMDSELSVEECFSKENFGRLQALKNKVDPENVFKNVPAKLVDA